MARGILQAVAWPLHALHQLRVSVWESLYEPRAVTALMLGCYTLTVATGGVVIRGGPETSLSILAVVFLIGGGCAGMPGSWRGAWWLEGPAAISTAFGWVVLGVSDLLITDGDDHWPGFTVGVCLTLALVMLARAVRVWHWSYAPGRGPRTTMEEQRARTTLSRRLLDDAELQQREGDHDQ